VYLKITLSKIFGQLHTRGGSEKRNYEKFGGQSIDYGGAVGVPPRVCLSGPKNPMWCQGWAGPELRLQSGQGQGEMEGGVWMEGWRLPWSGRPETAQNER